MSFDDTVVSGDDAPVLEIDPGAYNQPLYKKADSAIEHARLRAHDIVRGAKEIAERPEAYVELKIPMWPGMG